jgi:hypothetical protein
MKIFQVIFLVSIVLTSLPANGQPQDTLAVTSIEDAINNTLMDFRKRINDEDAVIYCIVTNNINMNLVDFNEKNLLVRNTINAKYIGRKSPNYLITFNITQEETDTVIDVAISSIKKVSRRIVEFNIQSYAITKTFKIVTY